MFAFVLISLLVVFILFKHKRENFPNYCSACGYKSRSGCSKCVNCGFCITTTGFGECVPGDSKGPYFREDCAIWEYVSPYYWFSYYPIFPIYYPRHRRYSGWRDNRRRYRGRGRRNRRDRKRS